MPPVALPFGFGLAAGATLRAVLHSLRKLLMLMHQAQITLKSLHTRLNAATRRRDFKIVPMIENQDDWDH